MKGRLRNPVPSSCHFSGVARSDSKLSAKALYGKWLRGSRLRCCAVLFLKDHFVVRLFPELCCDMPLFLQHDSQQTSYSLQLVIEEFGHSYVSGN